MIKEANDGGKETDDTNLVTADFENMYGKMPLDLSKAGVRADYCPRDGGPSLKPSTEELMEALDICQENNVFEFGGKLYKQKQGHATGQKQAPSVIRNLPRPQCQPNQTYCTSGECLLTLCAGLWARAHACHQNRKKKENILKLRF